MKLGDIQATENVGRAPERRNALFRTRRPTIAATTKVTPRWEGDSGVDLPEYSVTVNPNPNLQPDFSRTVRTDISDDPEKFSTHVSLHLGQTNVNTARSDANPSSTRPLLPGGPSRICTKGCNSNALTIPRSGSNKRTRKEYESVINCMNKRPHLMSAAEPWKTELDCVVLKRFEVLGGPAGSKFEDVLLGNKVTPALERYFLASNLPEASSALDEEPCPPLASGTIKRTEQGGSSGISLEGCSTGYNSHFENPALACSDPMSSSLTGLTLSDSSEYDNQLLVFSSVVTTSDSEDGKEVRLPSPETPPEYYEFHGEVYSARNSAKGCSRGGNPSSSPPLKVEDRRKCYAIRYGDHPPPLLRSGMTVDNDKEDVEVCSYCPGTWNDLSRKFEHECLAVKMLLGKWGLKLGSKWLHSFLSFFFNCPCDVGIKADICFKTFLCTDIGSSSDGVLSDVDRDFSGNRVDLPDSFVLQVVKIVDVTRLVKGCCSWARTGGPYRCLSLSDGVQEVYGFQYRPLDGLSDPYPAGLKVSVPNAWYGGLLNLIPTRSKVLGGPVNSKLEPVLENGVTQELEKRIRDFLTYIRPADISGPDEESSASLAGETIKRAECNPEKVASGPDEEPSTPLAGGTIKRTEQGGSSGISLEDGEEGLGEELSGPLAGGTIKRTE